MFRGDAFRVAVMATLWYPGHAKAIARQACFANIFRTILPSPKSVTWATHAQRKISARVRSASIAHVLLIVCAVSRKAAMNVAKGAQHAMDCPNVPSAIASIIFSKVFASKPVLVMLQQMIVGYVAAIAALAKLSMSAESVVVMGSPAGLIQTLWMS